MNGDGLIHIEFKSGGHDYFGPFRHLRPRNIGGIKTTLV